MTKKKTVIFDIVLLALNILFVCGTAFVFTACGAKDDGSYMTCHWAWVAVLSCAVVLLIQSVIRLFFKESCAKAAFSAAAVPLALLAAIIPNNLIKLCMMTDMSCHTQLKPFALVMGIIIAAVSMANIVVEAVSAKK